MAKVLLSFKDGFLAKIDQAADETHRTRTELIREAIRQYLGIKNEKEEEQ